MADDVVGRLIFQVDTDVDGAKKGMESFDDSLKNTQEIAKQTDEEVGKAQSGISAKGVAIAAAVGAAVVKLGQEVAQATSEIQAGRANIVNATGATGEALAGLMDSAKAVYEGSEESFDEVSRAIGEVNTRLGLTGTALEETTGQFLDFAGATGQDVQQSVISVTQAMNRWNLEADQLPTLLDKLTVAGQASGVSVASLTANLTANAGTLQAMGYSMDEAIAMMMTFEKQGIDSNAVLMAMKKSFEDSANAGTDARADWEDLLDSITNATDQTEANSIAIEAFGSRIATDMVTSLQNGSLNFDEFADAVANAEGTLEATDEASKTTADRIEQLKHSVTLMLSDVGEELAPMIEDLLPTVKELLDAVFNAIKPIIPVIGELVKQLLPPLVEVVKSVMDILLPIIENLLPPLASLLKLIGTIINAVLTILNPILTILSDLLGVGIGLVNSMLTPLLNLLTPIFQLIADAINAVLTPLVKVLEAVVGWIEGIVNGIKWLFGWIGDGIKQMLGFSDAMSETETEMVSFSGTVNDASTEVKDYTANVVDMTDAIEEGAKAFDIATPAVETYKVEINKTTEAVEEHTEAVKEEAKEVKTTATETVKQEAKVEKKTEETAKTVKTETVATGNAVAQVSEQTTVEVVADIDTIETETDDMAMSVEDAIKKLNANIGTAFSTMITGLIKGFDSVEDKIASMKASALAFAGVTGNAMYQLGKDLAEGNDAWTSLGKTALKALAAIVRALAEQMAAQAVIAGFEFRYGAAAALVAGSVAAFVGAGLIDGYADSLLIGKDYIPYDDFPARLHRGEMVLDRIEAEKFRRYGGMYGVEQMASAPLGVDTQRLSPLNINNQLSAVIEVDGTQLGIAVLRNIDNASQFVLRG